MNKYYEIISQTDYVDPWSDEGYGDNQRRQETYDTVYGGDDPPELSSLFGNLDQFTDYLIPIGVFLTILMVVIGGYMWIASAGNPDKVKQAQGTLTWAVIGIVFIAIATVLINLVINAIGNL